MISVAIDGPAGAGKSTIARAVAKKLEYIYVDTGALYRAIGCFVIQKGADYKNQNQVETFLDDINSLDIKFVDDQQRVILNSVDVSDNIRTPEASMAASAVSAVPKVREYLLGLQRNMAKNNNVIMDGRDIGTVVLPNANIKIFLTASPEERASRRFQELKEKGLDVDYNDVLSDIIQRDRQDSEREIAPLKPAHDSIILDTTGNTLEQSIQLMINTIKELL